MDDIKNFQCREAIVKALSKALEIFTSHSEATFNDVMTNGVRPMADAIGVDRVVVYSVLDIAGQVWFDQAYHWNRAEGGTTFLYYNIIAVSDSPVIERWYSIFSKGDIINMRLCDMPEDEKALW
jgi:hypothetical protein